MNFELKYTKKGLTKIVRSPFVMHPTPKKLMNANWTVNAHIAGFVDGSIASAVKSLKFLFRFNRNLRSFLQMNLFMKIVINYEEEAGQK